MIRGQGSTPGQQPEHRDRHERPGEHEDRDLHPRPRDREVQAIELLPPNEALAERAFHEDRRIRDLDRQWLDHLGIERRPVTYEANDDLSAEERTTREFLAVIGR